MSFACLRLGEPLGGRRRRLGPGQRLRSPRLELRAFQRGAGARHILARVAYIAIDVENAEKNRDEDQTPQALQIKPVEAEKPGAEPQQVGNKQRWPSGFAKAALPRHQIPGDLREDDQRPPVQPMRQHKIEARHACRTLFGSAGEGCRMAPSSNCPEVCKPQLPRARPCAGHPRLPCHGSGRLQVVDDRDKPGQGAIFSMAIWCKLRGQLSCSA